MSEEAKRLWLLAEAALRKGTQYLVGDPHVNITIKKLRRDFPDWFWRAERVGFGDYRYHGENRALGSPEERVVVRAESVLCGPTEDDYATRWMVDDGKQSTTYAAWWLSRANREPA
jgi:hypothetical protein